MAQRIIKFRGKSIISDEWLYGNFYDDGGEQYMLPTNLLDIDDYEKFQVDPDTVGEYTGLTDKMGIGVYEGDILRLRTFSNLSWDPKMSQEEAKEMRRVFDLDDLVGELEAESSSPKKSSTIAVRLRPSSRRLSTEYLNGNIIKETNYGKRDNERNVRPIDGRPEHQGKRDVQRV